MSKQDILNFFNDINYAYNNSGMHDSLSVMLDDLEREIRNKAIDEFAEKLKCELNEKIIPDKEKFKYERKIQEQICHQNTTLKRAIRYVEVIAEQIREV